MNNDAINTDAITDAEKILRLTALRHMSTRPVEHAIPDIEVRRAFGRLYVFTDHHDDLLDAMLSATENMAEFISRVGALHRRHADEAEVSIFVPDCGGVSEHGLVIAGANELPAETVIRIAHYVYQCAEEGLVPDSDDIRAALFFHGLSL